MDDSTRLGFRRALQRFRKGYSSKVQQSWNAKFSSLRAQLKNAVKPLFWLVALINGAIGIRIIRNSFSFPDIYGKDFIQEYLMAKAILNGVNPYLPVTELARMWLADANYNAISHPSLHPPVAGLLSLPLGLLSYRQASLVWFAFESACLLAALLLILRSLRKRIEPLLVCVVPALALGFAPVVSELFCGNLNACMLLLLVGSWLRLKDRREWSGGALLGGVIALKWIAWPIVLFLVLRRKWKSIIAAAAVLGATNVLAILALGFEVWRDYYLKIAPSASYIRAFEYNLSASALGLHLFSEMGWRYKLIPLWNSPTMAVVSSYLITLAVLLIGLRSALRASSFDTAFGLLTGVSILVSPVAWFHYLLLAAIPLAILVCRLSELGFPRRLISWLCFFLCPLLITVNPNGILSRIIAGEKTPEGVIIVTFAQGLLFMLPTASLIGILWLMWRLDGIETPQRP